MRWLLLKDLQILRRSPLVTGLLVVYPVLIAVLIGVALSGGPDEPRIAFLNEIPRDERVDFGEGGEFDTLDAKRELCDRVDCVEVSSRGEAISKVEDGEVLGALIIPGDLIDKLRSLRTLDPQQPTVEVLVNEEDPVKGQIVDDRLDAVIGELSPGQRAEVRRVIRFADLARENLDVAQPLLGAVAQPIEVDKQIVSGDSPTLDAFAISVAATVTLMFVTVLLVAGSLALEREENAYARLTRGLVGRTELLAEKLVLGVACSLVVTLVMLAGLELFVPLDWSRFPLWLPAIVAGGAAFAAFGAAIGGAAREVCASSLLAFMISLPIAFLSLVPSGTVNPTLFDVIEVAAALFPFEPALDAMSGALDEAGPSIGLPLVHLAAITLAYGVLARLALRRFT